MFGKKQPSLRRRLNRTPSESARSKRASVFSYRANRSADGGNTGRGQTPPSSGKQQAAVPGRRARFKARALSLAKVILVAAVIGVVGYNLILKGGQAQVVMVGGGTYRDLSAYQQAVVNAFGASKLLGSNKVTVNIGQVEDRLLADFPELADVSVRLPVVGHRPTVFLEPSTSRLILHTAQNDKFVLDSSGRAVAAGADVSRYASAGLPEVQDQSKRTVQLGDTAIPSTTVSYITEVARQLRAKNIAIASLTLLDAPGELHLRIKDEGYYIKLNARGDARVAVGSFLAVKSRLDAEQKKPGQYIDARIEKRVYYR